MGVSTSTRWLIGLAVAIVAVVAVSVAVALAGDTEEYPADTPQGTVQRYLQAVADRDADRALSYLSPELREQCEATTELRYLRDAIRQQDRDIRATLLTTRETDGETEVEVRITERYGDVPFGRDEYSHEEWFVLAEVEGEWRFVESPWPLWPCSRPPLATPTVVATPTVEATATPTPPATATPTAQATATPTAAAGD